MNIGETVRVEVATGHDPVGALYRAAGPYAKPGHVLDVDVLHDDGCPCLDESPLGACRCEVVVLAIGRLA